MNESKGKWEFLLPYITTARSVSPDITVTQLAEQAIQYFSLALSTEQVRKIISRLINSPDTETVHVSPFVGYTQAVVAPTPVLHLKHNKPGTYLVLGCWHAPFHHRLLTAGVMKMMEENRFDGLIMLGDFLDCNALSDHAKGKFTSVPGMTLQQEYAVGKQVLKGFVSRLPEGALKVYLYGNHENRYHRFIADMQNAKTPPSSPTEGLALFEQGFQVIENYQSGYMTLGNHLDLLHGVYYNTHCAKTHIDRFRGSVMFAHTHRIQSYIEGHTGGFNIGWGGEGREAAFNYADRGTKAAWQNGFATVTIDEQGFYYVNQVIANNGTFFYNGKKY